MELTKEFSRCLFASKTLREALRRLREIAGEDFKPAGPVIRKVATATEIWLTDDDDEFFGLYDAGFRDAWLTRTLVSGRKLAVTAYGSGTYGNIRTIVSVTAPARGEIQRVMSTFVDDAPDAYLGLPPRELPTIFIGHGGKSSAWRDLKDHLHEQHGYTIEAYETGARAGHTIRDILESMMKNSSFAVLVMTAEDEQESGSQRARQNVVHETGLFQGTLGFDRAIVVIEESVEPFSNLQGIHQLRFGAGGIKEIFGDVLATAEREFPRS